MPLPLAPLLPIVLRLGAVVGAGYAASHWIKRSSFPGRTDQRAEDALDDLGEGLSLHRPVDRADDRTNDRQTNASGRLRRVIRFGGTSWEIDAGILARMRLRRQHE